MKPAFRFSVSIACFRYCSSSGFMSANDRIRTCPPVKGTRLSTWRVYRIHHVGVVEGVSVSTTAPEELVPRGNLRLDVDALRQQAPELRDPPAQVVSLGVSVLADAGTELHDLVKEVLTRHVSQVFVDHQTVPLASSRIQATLHTKCRAWSTWIEYHFSHLPKSIAQ